MNHSKKKFKYLTLGAFFFSLSQLGQSNVGARFNELNPYVIDGIYFSDEEFRFFNYRRPQPVSLRNFPQTERQKVIDRISQKITILYRSKDRGLQLTLDRAIDLYGVSPYRYGKSVVGYGINSAILGPINVGLRGMELLIDGRSRDRHVNAFFYTKRKNVYMAVSCGIHAYKPRSKPVQLVDVNYCTLNPLIRSEGSGNPEYVVFKKGAGPFSGWANPPEK